MTNSDALRDKIKSKGLKLGFIVKKLDTSYAWLNKKINNEVPFKADEIQALCDLLEIKDLKEKNSIFFAKNVEKSST